MDPPSTADADDGLAGAADGNGDGVETRRRVVDAEGHGQRADKVLVAMAPEFSRTHLQSLIERAHVRVDGELLASASRRLRAGQAVEVDLLPTDESLAFRPQAMALDVRFEDGSIAVIAKPAGLVVHPAPGHWSGTLLNALLARHAGADRLPRAGIVHRLDKDTSGLMVVGKTLAAVTALSRAIAERRVQRLYLALAHGVVEPPLRTLDAPIGRDPVSRVKMAVVAGGKPARTDVERAAAAGEGAAAVSALVCRLHTGRTHQIRVHLAACGHPLVADATYGGKPLLGLERQALHAVRLVLPHPDDARPVAVDAAPPPDFARAWQAVTGRPPLPLAAGPVEAR